MIFLALARWQRMTSMVAVARSIDSIVDERRDRRNLVRLLADLGLRQHEPLATGEGGDRTDGLLGAFHARPPRGLAVDGDRLEPRFRQRRDLSRKTAPEGCGIERGEEVAEMIVARRPVGERQEPAKMVEFFWPDEAPLERELAIQADNRTRGRGVPG